MKKVLYISNIEVPYRTEFFNQLSQKCDLTVLYERKNSANRNSSWTSSVKAKYNIKYLRGIKIKNEFSFGIGIIKYIFSRNFDKIIFGCFNSPTQLLAMLLLRLFKKEYILNIDGDYFVDGTSFKKKIKRLLLKGATKYLVAGKSVKEKLSKHIDESIIIPYYFSSLSHDEIIKNSKRINENKNNKVIVVGQYFDYKGLDVALEVASRDNKIKYKFIGAGNRSSLLIKKVDELKLDNVEVVPFLQKEDLFKEYQNCFMTLLPSKKECWGLVINESSSFGCPIISTNGSGAAVEFLEKGYEKFLCESNDANSIYMAISLLRDMTADEIKEYKDFLISKSSEYYIEKNVEVFANVLDCKEEYCYDKKE